MRLWRLAGPPLVIWAGVATTVAVAAAAFGYAPFHGSTWARWDSRHYLTIAQGGYDFFRCAPDYPFPGWCGNAGWFPAYPWVVGGLHLVGLPLRGTAAAVSWLFAAGTLVLLWNTFFGRRISVTVLGAFVYAAFAPGQIYDYAIFPLSMLAFFTVLHLWFLQRGRWVAAGLAGAVAALSYPLGVLLVPVSAAWLLIEQSVQLRERLRRRPHPALGDSDVGIAPESGGRVASAQSGCAAAARDLGATPTPSADPRADRLRRGGRPCDGEALPAGKDRLGGPRVRP